MELTHEEKIRRGQAFNLAVQEAISLKEQDNVYTITKLFVKYYDLADALQKADLEALRKQTGE